MSRRRWKGVAIGSLLAAVLALPIDAQTSEPDSIPLAEVLRIGNPDTGEGFGYISAVARSEDGDWFIGDRRVPSIRRFSSAGQYLGSVGQPGEGPGEFRDVDGLVVTDSAELIVWDATNKRVSVFGPDGSFRRSYPVERGARGPDDFAASPDGTLHVWQWVGDVPMETPEGLIAGWYRVDPDGTVESVMPVPRPVREGPVYVISGRGGYFSPFVTETLSAMGGDGTFYTGRNKEYRIRRLHPDGTVSWVTRDVEQVSLTAEEKAQWEAWSDFFAWRAPDRPSDFYPIPDQKPFFRDLEVDASERLWVSRYTPAVFREEPPAEGRRREERGSAPPFVWRDQPRWDLFSTDDEYLGFVVLPFKTAFLGAEGNLAWGVQEGEGGDYLVVWSLGFR